MKKISSAIVMGIIVYSMGLTAYAATSWTGLTDSEFGTAGNWNNGAPGSPEGLVTIGTGGTVSNTLNYTGTNPYKLTIDGNSTLNSSANFTSTNLTIETGSTLNLTGGSYTLAQTSGANNTSKIYFYGTALLHITGGTHTFNERIVMGSADSIFRITGSAATVSVHQQTSFKGTMELVFDEAGVCTFESDSYLKFSNASLKVDATAYKTSVKKEFVLVDVSAAGASNPFGGNIDITVADGHSYTYHQDDMTTTGQIILTILPPEATVICVE